jgi:hypothetical protein
MEKLVKSKNEIILGTIGILLLASLIVIFSWGVGFLAINISKAISSGASTGNSMNFDLEAAKGLNLKGLSK